MDSPEGRVNHTDLQAPLARFEGAAASAVAVDGVGGMSAGVVVGPRIVWARSFGCGDVQRSVPAGEETIYRTGIRLEALHGRPDDADGLEGVLIHWTTGCRASPTGQFPSLSVIWPVTTPDWTGSRNFRELMQARSNCGRTGFWLPFPRRASCKARREILKIQAPEGMGGYGLGFTIDPDEDGFTTCWHNGMVAGYSAWLIIHPETHTGVVALRNYTWGQMDLDRVLLDLLKTLATGRQDEEARATEPTAAARVVRRFNGWLTQINRLRAGS